jgi:hypothetical protein
MWLLSSSNTFVIRHETGNAKIEVVGPMDERHKHWTAGSTRRRALGHLASHGVHRHSDHANIDFVRRQPTRNHHRASQQLKLQRWAVEREFSY